MGSANGNGRVTNGQLTVRMLEERDLAKVMRLAELDSAPAPPAPLVGVEENGSLLAAGSIATREIIADPFRRTAELRDVLSAALAAPW